MQLIKKSPSLSWTTASREFQMLVLKLFTGCRSISMRSWRKKKTFQGQNKNDSVVRNNGVFSQSAQKHVLSSDAAGNHGFSDGSEIEQWMKDTKVCLSKHLHQFHPLPPLTLIFSHGAGFNPAGSLSPAFQWLFLWLSSLSAAPGCGRAWPQTSTDLEAGG